MAVTIKGDGTAERDGSGAAKKAKANKNKKSNDSSSIGFPYLDLETGMAVVSAFLDAGGVPLTRDQLAGAMKLVAGSGNFVLRVGTARQFGLIESKDGKYQLTQLGFSIADKDEKRAKAAKAEAFLSVQLYRKAYETFRGKQLPPRPHGLESAFVDFGVAPKQKAKARLAFDRSAQQAGFFVHGDDRLVEPVIPTSSTSDRKSSETVAEAPRPPMFADGPMLPALDPLILGLLNRLPKAGEVWETEDRARWLQTLAANLDFVYDDEKSGQKIIIELKSPVRVP